MPFRPNFHIFLQFSGTKLALLSQPKARILPLVPCTSFLKTCSCSLQHFSQSFPGSTEHKCSKPRKTTKNAKRRFFRSSAIFFAETHFIGCRYICDKNLTDLHQRFPVEKGAFSKFSPTKSHLSDTSGHRGCIFSTLFLHI